MAAPATGLAQPPSQVSGTPASASAAAVVSINNVLPALNERRHSSAAAHSMPLIAKPSFANLSSPPGPRSATLAGAGAQQPQPAEATLSRPNGFNAANGSNETSIAKPSTSILKDIFSSRAPASAPPTPSLPAASATPKPAAVAKVVTPVSVPVPTPMIASFTPSTTTTTTTATSATSVSYTATPKAVAPPPPPLPTESETKSEPRPAYKMKRTGRPGFPSVIAHTPNGSRTPTPTGTPDSHTPSMTPPMTLSTNVAAKTQPKPPTPVPAPQPQSHPQSHPQSLPQSLPQSQPQPQPQPEIALQSSPKPASVESHLLPQSVAAAAQLHATGTKRHRESTADSSLSASQKRARTSQDGGPSRTNLQAFTISLLSDSGSGEEPLDENDNGGENAKDADEDGNDEGDEDDTIDADLYGSEEDDIEETEEEYDFEREGEEEDEGDGADDNVSGHSQHLRHCTAAPSGRPYNKYYDKKGHVFSTKGAIIPDGYKLWKDKATPWVCPIRSCRLLFPELKSMGGHFSRGHSASNINDNLDGTLTVISRPACNSALRLGARVISQGVPLTTEPMVEPRTAIAARVANTQGKISTKGGSTDKQRHERHRRRRQEVAGGPKMLVRSALGREYTKSLSGERAYGTLFPDGYEQSTYPGFPWVCPVRDCQRVLPAIQNLGAHFMKKHMYSQFNDNGDGTLSRVGTHSHVRPIVVSQRVRPASQMEPRAEQQPVGYKPVSAVSATQGISGSPHVQPPQPSVTTLQHTSAAAAAAAANKIAMWDYIKTFLTQGLRNQGVPNTGKAAMFFEVPRVRDVRWNEALEQRNPDVPKRASHLAALLIQVTGKEASSPCDFCRSGRGLYEGCVLVNSTATPDMHVAYEGCANCVSSPSRATCSHSHRARQRFARLFPHLNYDRVATELPSKLYKPRPAMMWTQGAVAASTATAATATATATTATVAGARGEKTDKMRDLPAHTRGSPDTDGEETLQRRDKSAAIIRRSGRIAEYGGESAPAPLYGIKSSSSSSISSSSVALARTAAHQKRDSPLLVAGDTQPALEMEDWEVAPGRVQAATNENIAFSNAYLTSSQMVPINHNMSYRVEVVRPGSTTTFVADSRSTRTCTLASGKLRVTVGDAAFVMGPHGMFLVAPGKPFSVENRLYIDAYLHITALHNQR